MYIAWTVSIHIYSSEIIIRSDETFLVVVVIVININIIVTVVAFSPMVDEMKTKNVIFFVSWQRGTGLTSLDLRSDYASG